MSLFDSLTHKKIDSVLFSNLTDAISKIFRPIQKRQTLLNSSLFLNLPWLSIIPILFLLSLPFAPDSTIQISSINSNSLDQVSVNQRQFGITILSPANLLLLPLFICWIIRIIRSRPKFFSYDLWLGFFLISIIYSTILSINSSASFVWMLKLFLGIFIFLVFSTYRFTTKYFYRFFYSISGIVFLELLLVTGQYINNGFLGTLFENENKIALNRLIYYADSKFVYFRNVGSFSHPNMLAAFLAIFLPVSLFFLFHPKKLFKLLGLTIFILSFGMIFVTLSRSGVITAAAAVGLTISLFFYYFPYLRSEIFKWARILFLLVLVIFISATFNPFVQFRFFNITLEDQSLLTRLELNQIAISTIAHAPLFGIGGGTFPIYLANFDPSLADKHLYNIHNLYLTLLTENGVIPTLFFLTTICVVFNYFFSKIQGYKDEDKKISLTLMSITMLFFINGFFEPRSFSDRIGFFFWLFLGLLTNFMRYTRSLPVSKFSQSSHSSLFILISSSAFISLFRRFFSKWLLPN
jgi:O-antigen ligase